MYWKNFRFYPKKMFLRVSEDSEISPKSSILHGLYILLDCARVLQKIEQWTESPQSFCSHIAAIIKNVLLYISLMYLLICRSYYAFNADQLDKTSPQKLQFEKVIIPIL